MTRIRTRPKGRIPKSEKYVEYFSDEIVGFKTIKKDSAESTASNSETEKEHEKKAESEADATASEADSAFPPCIPIPLGAEMSRRHRQKDPSDRHGFHAYHVDRSTVSWSNLNSFFSKSIPPHNPQLTGTYSSSFSKTNHNDHSTGDGLLLFSGYPNDRLTSIRQSAALALLCAVVSYFDPYHEASFSSQYHITSDFMVCFSQFPSQSLSLLEKAGR